MTKTKIGKFIKQGEILYRVYMEGDKIILEPVKEMPEKEAWLFNPNKHLLEKLKKGLKQKGSIKRIFTCFNLCECYTHYNQE